MMAEEATAAPPRKYTAFSEEAMAEQIAQLTAIASQQATAIQNLSASIAQLSAGRYGQAADAALLASSSRAAEAIISSAGKGAVQLSPLLQNIGLVEVTGVTPPPPVNKRKRGAHAGNSSPTAAASSTGRRMRHTASVPQSGTKKTRPSNGMILRQSIDGEEDLAATMLGTDGSAADGEQLAADEAGRGNQMGLSDQGEASKRMFLGLLQALRDNYDDNTCGSIVRARLCGDLVAVRPEELLGKLRGLDVEVEVPQRKQFINSVMMIGEAIIRGRSVKFGRETRRALAIPRAYFTPQELIAIDQNFLLGPRRAKRESEQNHSNGVVENWEHFANEEEEEEEVEGAEHDKANENDNE